MVFCWSCILISFIIQIFNSSIPINIGTNHQIFNRDADTSGRDQIIKSSNCQINKVSLPQKANRLVALRGGKSGQHRVPHFLTGRQ